MSTNASIVSTSAKDNDTSGNKKKHNINRTSVTIRVARASTKSNFVKDKTEAKVSYTKRYRPDQAFGLAQVIVQRE